MVRCEDGGPLSEVDRCAREQVHLIGHIQSHGLLFALSEPDLIVRQVSTNVDALLGMSPQFVMGRSLETVVDPRQFEAFRSQIVADDLIAANPLRMLVGKRGLAMNCVAHRQDGVLIVEFELVQGTYSLEPLNIGAHIRIPLSHLEKASDILELSRLAASQIRRLSGFDRVMVYRFDEQWNGEVIAETAGPSPVSYLGLRFPSTDIPAQARRLFLLNTLRAIADVGSASVPIVPEVGPQTGKPLDLTRSFLRTASPVHLEYLRNMGVQSSMTVSIVVRQRLWGMIACHHAAPRPVDCSTRSVCELIGQIFASQVALRIDNVALSSRLQSRRRLENYMAGAEASEPLVDAEPFQSERLLDLFDADGLVARMGDVVFSHGAAVEEASLLAVIGKLRKLASRGIASSNSLGAFDRTAESYASTASGALYLGLSEEAGDYLLLLRRELVETVTWAGNPDKAVSADAEGTLRPRTSFAAWQETVRGRSRPWSEIELENACFLREQLLQLRKAQKLHKSEEQVRYLANHDALTGLVNRHSIHLKLEQCVSAAVAEHSSFVLLFIDLDHFKYFNDRLGHAAGDRILTVVATRMQHQVRAQDVVGRLGGDEFIVIMPGLLETDAFKAAARILSAIEEPLEIQAGSRFNITASIGLSRCPADGTSVEVLLTRSDMAMYSVKRKGGNALESFQPGDPGSA